MSSPTDTDPYAGNVLVQHLGPILSAEQLLDRLTTLPTVPSQVDGMPHHIRMHHLLRVRDLHIPPLIERQLAQTVDLMIRGGYQKRDPAKSKTWSVVGGSPRFTQDALIAATGAAVEGHSGVGKSVACWNCLHLFPQTVEHDAFPRIHGGLQQVVHLSVEVPSSGKAVDLARALREQWALATGSGRFADGWTGRKDGEAAFNEWRQVAMSHFLGILHIDEVQNLFQLASLKRRRARKSDESEPLELAIVEERCLRLILSLSNTSGIPLLFSGTPDGMAALTRRLSTLSRMTTMGYHPIDHFSALSQSGCDTFLEQLGTYQLVKRRLEMSKEVKELIIDLTGGVQRLIIALWVAAHRVAFERESDDLCLEDFRMAAATWLAPVSGAVKAITSEDPEKMSHYEDLVVRDSAFWDRFWSSIHATS